MIEVKKNNGDMFISYASIIEKETVKKEKEKKKKALLIFKIQRSPKFISYILCYREDFQKASFFMFSSIC